MRNVFSNELAAKNNNRNRHVFTGIAVWFIDNTTLTFYQIAQSCYLTLKEIQNIADGEIEIEEYNPVFLGMIVQEEIDDCEKNQDRIPILVTKNIKKRNREFSGIAGLSHMARRRDKPDAVYYLLQNFPELCSSVIAQLVGTTNHTVEQIRNGSHHNMRSLKPRDPVLADLCKQEILDAEVEKARVEKEKQERLKNINNSY